MNNCEKLLRAFIEAQGYEIEEVKLSPLGLRVDELRMMNSVIDYKVTKKPSPLSLIYNKVPVEQLVRNIHELSVGPSNLRWIKYPKESFTAVTDWFGDLVEDKTDTYCTILDVEVFLDE